MAEKNSKVGLRILKYKNYIKKHPQKPYGYYCLGHLYITEGKYKTAEQFFSKALSLNSGYTLAKIGLIKCFICRGKILKAVRFYNANMEEINSKQIFIKKLIRNISSCWDNNLAFSHQGLFPSIILKYSIKALETLYKSKPCNIVATLILCIYYLAKGDIEGKALSVYNSCVCMDAITDSMRWTLVKTLSTANPDIFENTAIAEKFSRLPEPNCPPLYANKIFEAALKYRGSMSKAKIIFESMEKPDKVISLLNLWEYTRQCSEASLYDVSVYRCCSILLKAGWVDKVLAGAVKSIKKMNIVHDLKQEERILHLFGYMD
ncbi:MAG: tetratricopeptide repeat protein [Acetivibrionales bacterium]